MSTLACLAGMATGGAVGGLMARRHWSNGDYSAIVNIPTTLIFVGAGSAIGGLTGVFLKDMRSSYIKKIQHVQISNLVGPTNVSNSPSALSPPSPLYPPKN